MGENNYNPWYTCSNIYNENKNHYTQRNNNGFKCCNKPNVQDIIYSLDSGFEQTIPLSLISPSDSQDIKIGKYLTLYETIVKSCVYFKTDDKGFIPVQYNSTQNNYNGLSKYLKTDYEELYDYALKSANILLILFQQNSTSSIHYLKFFENNSQCYHQQINSGVSIKADNNYTPKYFIYTDKEDVNYFIFIPICVKGITESVLSTYTVPNLEFKINNVTNSNGKDCTKSKCTSDDFNSFTGQNISGNTIYRSKNSSLKSWYVSDYSIGLYIFIGVIIIIIGLLLIKKKKIYNIKWDLMKINLNY